MLPAAVRESAAPTASAPRPLPEPGESAFFAVSRALENAPVEVPQGRPERFPLAQPTTVPSGKVKSAAVGSVWSTASAVML